MATKFDMTQLAALTVAADALARIDTDEARAAFAVISHMAAQKAKPSKKASGPTKSQLVNLGLARDVAAFIWALPADELVTSKTVVTTAGIPEIATTQKATAILGIAADNGWVTRREVKSRVYWAQGEVNPTA